MSGERPCSCDRVANRGAYAPGRFVVGLADPSREGAAPPEHDLEGHIIEARSEDFFHARELQVDNEWFKTAVFYEVLVRAFFDSSATERATSRG